jgi:hypothetical protein
MRKQSLFCVLVLTAFSGGFFAACLGDDPTEGEGLTRDTPFGEDAGTDGAEEMTVVNPPFCPAADPKIGDPCPREIDGDTRCSYVQRQCTFNGNLYDIRIEYCCFQGSWNHCGTNQTPCDTDTEDAGAEEGDGGDGGGMDAVSGG